jgi:hypothetical protein
VHLQRAMKIQTCVCIVRSLPFFPVLPYSVCEREIGPFSKLKEMAVISMTRTKLNLKSFSSSIIQEKPITESRHFTSKNALSLSHFPSISCTFLFFNKDPLSKINAFSLKFLFFLKKKKGKRDFFPLGMSIEINIKTKQENLIG